MNIEEKVPNLLGKCDRWSKYLKEFQKKRIVLPVCRTRRKELRVIFKHAKQFSSKESSVSVRHLAQDAVHVSLDFKNIICNLAAFIWYILPNIVLESVSFVKRCKN